ncbi:hypothetical protein BDV95DRAFT_599596 [Massariosphaeria phaeospora]|uniref:SET domain-containing protein n=1 Tax=Massariosphaeria phaeospora TaxID=100035 RepID=A0A7C8M072_9PLEO|nr:hypothetical protein BDV95DRAFT_599596 [Massariosphaeria phaeospora]
MAPNSDSNTVFLTEKEAERIRSTVKTRLERCSELTGRPRKPRDSTDAIKEATGASLMADMGGAPDPDMTETQGPGGTIPALAVGEPYPPCIVSLQDLQPMGLADLQLNTHHRGRLLTVKRVSPVVTLVARSWAMVQDKMGKETERLEVCLHKSRHGEDVLESASGFVIKEPFFTLTDHGEATIRVDHPSDLIVYDSQTADGSSLASDTEVVAAEQLARMCKDKGNAALKQKDLPQAHAQYTEGLKVAKRTVVSDKTPDLARDLFRNRAYVNLLLEQLDEAKADAKASITGKEDPRSQELDSKAFFRAGCAAYALGDHQEAKGFFEEQRKRTPSDKDAIAYLRKIELRISEQETGRYDLGKIRAGLSRVRPRADAADFINKTKVSDSPGRGRGLFAATNILAGEIVICEKAFCVVWGHEREALTAMTYDVRDDRIRVSPVGLSKSIVQKLLSNPSQIERVLGLYGDYTGNGDSVSRTEDGPVVDTFRVHDIVSRNAFGPGNQHGKEDARHASTGLWIRAACINHSCVPNAKKEFIGDLMVFRATRAITAGEELFHSYDLSSDYDARQTALTTTWGFECRCALCSTEEADDVAVRNKRRELASEADAFVETEHWANAKRLTIMRAQRLKRAIDGTYDAERFESVPRLAAQAIEGWLAKASPRR